MKIDSQGNPNGDQVAEMVQENRIKIAQSKLLKISAHLLNRDPLIHRQELKTKSDSTAEIIFDREFEFRRNVAAQISEIARSLKNE